MKLPGLPGTKDRAKSTAAETMTFMLDSVVTTGRGVFVRGWAFARSGAVEDGRIQIGGASVEISEWLPRPDVVAAHPDLDVPLECGFAVEVPLEAVHDIVIAGHAGPGEVSAHMKTADRRPEPHATAFPAFDAFVDWVNAEDRRVLEIGSRVVVTDSLRARFGAGRYVGFDIHADENTDIVGDAHRLGEYVEAGSFDAVFSMYVLEHLAMPWVVAAEINKVLRQGGRTFHATNQTWPMHAWPWDFFRFSTQGLGVLFSEPVGFRVLESDHSDRVEVNVAHDAQQAIMLAEPAFASSWVLAEKIGAADATLQWGAATSDVTGGTSYPLPGAT